MRIIINQQVIDEENIDCVEDSYVFAPSIGKPKIINGKKYFVRSIFRGGQNFETVMKGLASEHFYNTRR